MIVIVTAIERLHKKSVSSMIQEHNYNFLENHTVLEKKHNFIQLVITCSNFNSEKNYQRREEKIIKE